MDDIQKFKIQLAENPLQVRKAFRFTFTKTAILVPAAPVDEASVKIVEAHQQRAEAEAQKRALTEAHVRALAEARIHALAEAEERALAEANIRALAEAQQRALAEAEEESQRWNTYYIAQNALKREKQLAEEQHEKQEQATEDARKRALTGALTANLYERYLIVSLTPDAPVAPVAPVIPVTPVARTRHFNVARPNPSL
jgi:hypothetical protein